jgi:DNA-binding beta-propeller fold protein YncE
MRVRLISIFFCLLLVIGCSKGNLQTGTIGGTTGGILYVSTSAAIQHFNSAFSINGNVAPSATISGAATLLSAPSRLLLDATSNRLFVSSSGSSSILIFENISTTSGNAAPSRTISGASTLLATPTDLALDTVNNALYVADGTRILLFLSASTVTGNVPPVHNINLGFSIGSILLDSTNNRLYVADTSGNAVDRLEGASLQDGTAVIAATISGISSGLSHPDGLALDAGGSLFVANQTTPSITIYANAASLNGNVVPSGNLAGPATLLGSPGQLVINSSTANGELYVADTLAGGVLIFSSASGLNGNVAPTRTVIGSSTGLAANNVDGIALDTTR